jgi:hypothetical protein
MSTDPQIPASKSLDEFIADCKADADRFKAMWDKNRAEHPHAYPSHMNEGDWFDQFLLFLNSTRQSEP